MVSFPANFIGTPAGGFLFSSPSLWHLSELLYHPLAIATPPLVGSESQPGLEEKFRGGVEEVFQVVLSLGTLPFTMVRVALYI